jgi:hypothetical protein
VIRWLAGGAPRRDEPDADSCPRCGHARHEDLDGAAYCHLLGPRYTFSNRSEDIKATFCAHLDLLGIAWRRAGPANISSARREAVAALDAFVGPKA